MQRLASLHFLLRLVVPKTGRRVVTRRKSSACNKYACMIEGLLAAPFTPLRQDGELNVDVIPSYVDHLVKEGCQGVFVSGTTGEGLLFSVEERKKLADHWVTNGKDRLKYTIIQVGAESIKDTQELAKHAQDIGATSIAVLPPIYYKPASPGILVDYFKQIYQAAPKIPLLYYHIPSMSGVTFSLEDVFSAAQDKVPTFAGAKFTSPDLADMERCLTVYKGRYHVLYGGDGMILGACAMGATSSIGVTFNYAGNTAKATIEAVNKGDFKTARKHQNRIQALMKIIQDNYGRPGFPLAVHKAVMCLRGIDVGPSRAPHVALKQSEIEKLSQDLKGIGFFDWSSDDEH